MPSADTGVAESKVGIHGRLCVGKETCCDSPTTTNILDRPCAETIGTWMGPYKLIEEISQGGMGIVYMAEPKKPVRRRIAIKLVESGMASLQVLARLDAERKALAIIDHPSIARSSMPARRSW